MPRRTTFGSASATAVGVAAAAALAAHEADTTNIHGIPDTSLLGTINQTINAQTDDYTLVLTDATKLVTLSNAGAKTLTVPTNASVAFPVGTHVDLAQIGAGQFTVAAAGGVTVNGTPGLKFRAQYSGATLVKTATNTWLCFGDLAA